MVGNKLETAACNDIRIYPKSWRAKAKIVEVFPVPGGP